MTLIAVVTVCGFLPIADDDYDTHTSIEDALSALTGSPELPCKPIPQLS